MSLMEILIHVSRVTHDHAKNGGLAAAKNFNPRESCDSRPDIEAEAEAELHILIHVSRVTHDKSWLSAESEKQDFNPRESCDSRRQRAAINQGAEHFNPRESCDSRLAMIIPPLISV